MDLGAPCLKSIVVVEADPVVGCCSSSCGWSVSQCRTRPGGRLWALAWVFRFSVGMSARTVWTVALT